jgi:hypothetical protein
MRKSALSKIESVALKRALFKVTILAAQIKKKLIAKTTRQRFLCSLSSGAQR